MFRRASVIALSLLLTNAAWAEEPARPDTLIGFDISAEDWVTTKTAHVTLNVEAAVTAATAGAMRGDMAKAVGDVAKTDWRLAGFSRNPDQTGMEHWSAAFDARLPEASLGGLSESAKKASKPGMQITVGDIDFSPTLDETEAARAGLRLRLYKQAADQLTAINAALPGKTYRIAEITFDAASESNPPPQPRLIRRPIMAMAVASRAPAPDEAVPGMERAQRLVTTAHVTYASLSAAAPASPGAAH